MLQVGGSSGKGGTTYEKYNMLCYKWQNKAKKVFCDALTSNEYVLVRNALRVLARMIKVGGGFKGWRWVG